MTKAQHASIERMLEEGLRKKAIAKKVGLGVSTIVRVANGEFRRERLERGPMASQRAAVLGKRKKGGLSKGADPTPDEIAEACRRLRAARFEDDDADGWLPPGAVRPLTAIER